MSQKQETVLIQSIENFEFLNTPYSIVETFIKYNKILSPDRLWVQLFKIISFTGVIQLEEVLKIILQDAEQSSLDALNSKLAIMGILGLLVITWIRNVKLRENSSEASKNQKVQIFLNIDFQTTQINKPIIVQIRSKQKLKKNQICRLLYCQLERFCKIHQFQLQLNYILHTICLKGSNFTFNGLSLPSALQLSLNQVQTKNMMMIVLTQEPQTSVLGISLSNYILFLKYFQSESYQGVISLKNFFNLYCEKMEKILQKYNEKFQYYNMLSPKNIFVVENKEKKEIDFHFNIKSYKLEIYNKEKVPSEVKQIMYFDKSLQKHQILHKGQLWSAGLSILAVLADWQSLQFFQKYYQDMEKIGPTKVFIQKEVEKIAQNINISTYFINKLKWWLNLSQVDQTLKPHNKQKQLKKNRQGSWEVQILNENKDNSVKKSTTPSLSSLNNSLSKDFSSNSHNKSINFVDQKIVSDDDWQKCLQKIKEVQKQQRQNIQNIFAMKMLKEELNNIYQHLGYYSLESIKQKFGNCSYCDNSGLNITNYCGHSRCLKCYQIYLKQKLTNQGQHYYIICPQQDCNLVISRQTLQIVLDQQKQMQKVKQDFLTKLNKLSVQNGKDQSLKRCMCSKQSSYFKVIQKNLMFLCDKCNNYICVHCLRKFHGSVDCNRDFSVQVEKRLKQILKNKDSLKFLSKKLNLEKLLSQIKNMNIQMIEELQATLRACVTQLQAFTIKQKNSQNLLIIERVVNRLSSYLTNFYFQLPLLENKKQEKVATINQEMRSTAQKMRQLHQLSQTILYMALK